MSCLNENTVQQFLTGGLNPSEVSAVDQHIDSCADCRRWIANAAASTDGRLPASEVLLSSGTKIDRYTIDTVIGAGSFGIVYAAHDDKLDRPVAIKSLRGCDDVNVAGEALVLAKLQHPNIVQVYDALTDGGRVLVVMELVDGTSLDVWACEGVSLAAYEKTLRGAIEATIASHESDIIHRDLKPANILVDVRGEARLVDFGLAKSAEEQLDQVAGTRVYMAPETHGGSYSESSDQFALCSSFVEIARHVVSGGRRLKTIRAHLEKGMNADPQKRHRSMAALREALFVNERAWVWPLVAAVIVVVPVAIAFMIALKDSKPAAASCDLAAPRTIWQRYLESSRAHIGVIASGHPRAGERLQHRFETWTVAQQKTRQSQCAKPKLAPAVDQCLVLQSEIFAHTVEALMALKSGEVADAHALVDALGEPKRCEQEGVSWPSARDERGKVHAARLLLAQADMALWASDQRTAASKLDQAKAIDVEFPPLAAEVAWHEARLLEEQGKLAEAAMRAAEVARLADVAGQDALRLDAYVLMLRAALNRPQDEARVPVLVDMVQGALARAGNGSRDAARVEVLLARVAARRSLDESIERGKRAIRLFAQTADKTGMSTASAALAWQLSQRGDTAQALLAYDNAIAWFSEVRGPDHPRVASYLSRRAAVLTTHGDHAEAQQTLVRSIEILKHAPGAGGKHASAVVSLARNYSYQEKHTEAAPLYEQGLQLAIAARGESAPLAITIMANLGATYTLLGQHEEAQAILARAMAALDTRPHQPIERLAVSINLGVAQRATGDKAAAKRTLENAARDANQAGVPPRYRIAALRELLTTVKGTPAARVVSKDLEAACKRTPSVRECSVAP